MTTLKQLRARKRELQDMRYRKKTRYRVPKSDKTAGVLAWVGARLVAVNKKIKETEAQEGE